MNYKSQDEINNEFDCFMHNIAYLRNHYGLSKKKMAEILEISVKTLNKIENGIFPRKLTVNVVINIKKHFNISPKIQFEKRL